MREFLLNVSAQQMVLTGLVFFGGIYFVFGSINWLLTQKLLPKWGIGKILDPRTLKPGQIRRELSLSALSILLFGVGMLAPWGILQLGWANLAYKPSAFQIGIEVAILIIWNDVHFYFNHRLLHTRWLRRFHKLHHKSVVTTPWSTYSFHPVEAIMLGNVILLPMLIHDFSAFALISVPLFSLFSNSIGHSNYDFKPEGNGVWQKASRRHHLHHACYHGNFGFMFGFMDTLMKTALPNNAADRS